MGFFRGWAAVGILAFLACNGISSVYAQTSSLSFPPFEQWKSALLSNNTGALQGLYSKSPVAQVQTPGGTVGTATDISFWTALKIRSLNGTLIRSRSPQPGIEEVLVSAEIASPGTRARYISAVQAWQDQNGQWRLVAAKRTGLVRLPQPVTIDKSIYPSENARQEIQRALAQAASKHKRVLVVFGADWCYDCHVLDSAFHRPELAAVLRGNFEIVHVDVGQLNKNLDLAAEYDVPLKKGIPALAVLDRTGKLLFSQKNGEFENTNVLGPEDLLAFLNKWKPR